MRRARQIFLLIGLTALMPLATATTVTMDATSATNHSFWWMHDIVGSRHLQFENPNGSGVGNFELDMTTGTARLTGRVTSSDGSVAFDVDVLAEGMTESTTALCDDAKYESGATQSDCMNHWDIFVDGLTGTFNEVGGQQRNFLVDTLGLPNPQYGTNKANAKNNNLGFSAWIWYELASCDGCSLDVGDRYRGDINIDVAPVPVPAPLALVGLGLMGIAALRRRRLAR